MGQPVLPHPSIPLVYILLVKLSRTSLVVLGSFNQDKASHGIKIDGYQRLDLGEEVALQPRSNPKISHKSPATLQ